jgi:two-component system chemotaxis response regulator CheY
MLLLEIIPAKELNMKYIAIIDDSQTIRMAVEFAVKSFGLAVMQAGNGISALGKIAEIKSKGNDVVLCVTDINMPQMDGITFIKEFRKTDKFTPILVLTTDAENEKIKQGKDAGASAWIIKPFTPAEFTDIVKKLIKI